MHRAALTEGDAEGKRVRAPEGEVQCLPPHRAHRACPRDAASEECAHGAGSDGWARRSWLPGGPKPRTTSGRVCGVGK